MTDMQQTRQLTEYFLGKNKREKGVLKMHMKKRKISLLLICFILVFTSVPVSAADMDGRDIPYDGVADDTASEDHTEEETDAPVSVPDGADEGEEDKNTADVPDGSNSNEPTAKEDVPDTGEDSGLEAEESDEEKDESENGLSKNDAAYNFSEAAIEARIKNRQTSYIYTGNEIKPEVEVLYHTLDASGKIQAGVQPVIIDPKFYEVKYENNIHAGKASITVTGIDDPSVKKNEDGKADEGVGKQEETGTYTGKKEIEFQIAPADINSCQFQIPAAAGYTGKAVTLNIVATYQGKQLTAKKDYTVTYKNNKKKGKATVEIRGTGDFTGSKTASFTIKLAAPSVKASSSYSKIKLTWKKVKSASGYVIYRSTSPDGKYKKIKTYTSGSKTSYTDSKAKFGKKYYYKVRAYEKVKVKVKKKTKTKKEYSSNSAVVLGQRKLGATAVKTAKCASERTAKLTWKKVTGAQGYEIYRSESANGAYVRAATVKGSSKVSHTVTKLVPGVKYYFKVRAYRKSGSKKYYSSFSAPKLETFTDGQRLYLLFPGGVPTTKAQMEQYLVTITVPIKDVNGVPGTMQLRVHKALTKEFMGAFQDMYAIGFPVRAEDTDTYNWRSMASGKNRSHHSYGCVVDLNWNSNPMIGVTQGKYRPGVDPYSVTPQVVAIWKKHGFYWGGSWKSSKDYMHFTYTNH